MPVLPAVGSFGHEPGPSDADEAPECGEDDDREGKGMGCHGLGARCSGGVSDRNGRLSKQVQVPAEGDAHARRDPSQGGPGPSESAHP